MTDRPPYPGTPRWVKLSGIVALILVLLVIIVMVTTGGNHGPARHIPSGEASNRTSPIAQGSRQP